MVSTRIDGARDVLTAADLPLLRDGVVLANAGHFPAEIAASCVVPVPSAIDTAVAAGYLDRKYPPR